MRLWIDDVRPAPRSWDYAYSVNGAIDYIKQFYDKIEIISLDHDAGDYGPPDYIKILDWAEETYGSDFEPSIRLHSANPVGVMNMRRIIERNGWKEIK